MTNAACGALDDMGITSQWAVACPDNAWALGGKIIDVLAGVPLGQCGSFQSGAGTLGDIVSVVQIPFSISGIAQCGKIYSSASGLTSASALARGTSGGVNLAATVFDMTGFGK
jgi:hypothetical protein